MLIWCHSIYMHERNKLKRNENRRRPFWLTEYSTTRRCSCYIGRYILHVCVSVCEGLLFQLSLSHINVRKRIVLLVARTWLHDVLYHTRELYLPKAYRHTLAHVQRSCPHTHTSIIHVYVHVHFPFLFIYVFLFPVSWVASTFTQTRDDTKKKSTATQKGLFYRHRTMKISKKRFEAKEMLVHTGLN